MEINFLENLQKYLVGLFVDVFVSKNKEMKEERRRMTIIKPHTKTAVVILVMLLYTTATQTLR